MVFALAGFGLVLVRISPSKGGTLSFDKKIAFLVKKNAILRKELFAVSGTLFSNILGWTGWPGLSKILCLVKLACREGLKLKLTKMGLRV